MRLSNWLGRVLLILQVLLVPLGRAETTLPVVTQSLPTLSARLGQTGPTVDLSQYLGLDGVNGTVVQFSTNLGTFNVEVLPEVAPSTVQNFLNYVGRGAYTNSFFHRSVPNFVIQGGGFTIVNNTVTTVPADPAIALEYNRANTRGTLSMARGSALNSATSQWFINTVDNTTTLGTGNNGGYAVFARVLGTGMTVVDAIAALTVYDASASLGSAFGELPLRGPTLTVENLAFVNSVQEANVVPDGSSKPAVLSFAVSTSNAQIATAAITGGTLTVTPVAVGSCTVTVRATDTNGNVTDARFATTVAGRLPTITTQPQSQVVSAGERVSFTVVASGTGSLSYQWYELIPSDYLYIENRFVRILRLSEIGVFVPDPAERESLVFNYDANGTDYRVTAQDLVDNPNLQIYSTVERRFVAARIGDRVVSIVGGAPVVDAFGNAVYVSNVALFREELVEGPPGWSSILDWWGYEGVQTATLTIPSARAGDGPFRCIVSDSFGSVISETAELTILNVVGPQITSQPQNQAVSAGGSVSFSVAASGTGSLSYQWYELSTTFTWTFSGDPMFVRCLTLADMSGGFVPDPSFGEVLVYNFDLNGSEPGGTDYLVMAQDLIDNPNLQVYSPLEARFVAAKVGDRVPETVGGVPLKDLFGNVVYLQNVALYQQEMILESSYEWIPLENSSGYHGTRTATLTIPSASQSMDGASFSCVVSDSVGTTVSEAAELVVRGAGLNLAQALPLSSPDVVTTSGDAPWLGLIRSEEGDMGMSVVESGAISDGQQSRLTAMVQGPCVGSFLWKVSSEERWDFLRFYIDGVEQGGGISGETGWSEIVFEFPAGGHTLEWVYAKDSSVSLGYDCGWVRNLTITKLAAPLPVISSHPADVAGDIGTTASFSVVATGAPPLTYQWYLNGEPVPGMTSATFPPFTIEDYHNGWLFYCVVTNASGSVTSRIARLKAVSPLDRIITSNPESLAGVVGEAGAISVQAPTASAFQWFKGGNSIPGANSSTLAFANLSSADAGIYDVQVTSSAGTVLSLPVVVGVKPANGARTVGTVTTRTEWQNIRHSNGSTYDQFLLTGSAGTFTADPTQIARCSFLDENGSIVQVEMSGSGAITIVLENASGPKAPALYNQSGIEYMQGKATLVLSGADGTTHFTIYSVGTATNPGVTKADVSYSGWADIAAAAIISTTGEMGGIHQGNANYNATKGITGLYAPTVNRIGFWTGKGAWISNTAVIHGITAGGSAQPYLFFGANGAVKVKVAGSDLNQPNGDCITVQGLSHIDMGAGQDSCGRFSKAAPIAASLVLPDGWDVTDEMVAAP